jgi:uncharacterized protein YdeI (BOF family)
MTRTTASYAPEHNLTFSGRKIPYGRLTSLFVALVCACIARPALAADPTLTPIKTITKAMAGQAVTVQAPISSIREPSSARAPYAVSLTQYGATLPLIYWSDMQPQVAAKVKVGNTIRVTAAVNIYREQLQLKLSDPSSMNVIGPDGNIVAVAAAPPAATPPPTTTATTPAAEPTATVIGAIKPDWTGRLVVISGTISASESVEKTQHLTIQDATGEIQAVLEEKVLSGLSASALQPGRTVTITGPVKVESGVRTIIPETASAVKLAPQ